MAKALTLPVLPLLPNLRRVLNANSVPLREHELFLARNCCGIKVVTDANGGRPPVAGLLPEARHQPRFQGVPETLYM